MRRALVAAIASAALVAPVVVLASPASAATACVDLTGSVSPSTASAGSTVTISGSITNCGSTAVVAVVKVKVAGPKGTLCAGPFERRERVSLAAGESKGGSMDVTAPPCKGVYRGVATARVGGVLLDRLVVTFTVA